MKPLHHHLRHLHPSHEEPHKWVIIMVAVLIVILGVVLFTAKPDNLYGIPAFGPTVTPTPLASKNIEVSWPLGNGHVNQRFIVSGKARVFENVVSIRIKERLSGKLIGETTTLSRASDAGTFGAFQTGIELDNHELKPGTDLLLEVYQASPKDGRDTDTVVVPITFDPQYSY